MPKSTIGQLIREARKRQGLTMEQLGKKMGISGSLVGRYERGEENPKIETVERFANALGILVADLYPDWLYSEEVDALEHSNSNSFQARLIRAIRDLDGEVGSRAYEYGEHDEVTPELENKWAKEALPDIARKYDLPVEVLQKNMFTYEKCSTLFDDFDLVAMADFFDAGRRAIRLLECLNEKGQEAAFRHMQELVQIPAYKANALFDDEEQTGQAVNAAEDQSDTPAG